MWVSTQWTGDRLSKSAGGSNKDRKTGAQVCYREWQSEWVSHHIWTTAISVQPFRKPLGQILKTGGGMDEPSLWACSAHVGMGTRKHRSSVVISWWMTTIYRMQRNFLSGPWIQHILFFYAFLDPGELQLLFQNHQRNPFTKWRNCRSSNTAFAGMPPSLRLAYDFLLGMSNRNG